MKQPSFSPILCPTLIGREAELAIMDRLIARTWEGSGQLGLIAGEAGVGKSRLVSEISTRFLNHPPHAQRAQASFLAGRSFEPDRNLPYAPLLDVLHSYLIPRSPDEIRRIMASTAADLVKLLPELKAIMPDLRPNPTLEPEQEKRRMFEVLHRFLALLTEKSPSILVVEDIHWSDPTSLDFLLYLARRLDSLPILLLVTYRDDQNTPQLSRFLAELSHDRLGTELTLQRLDRQHTEAMIRATLHLHRALPTPILAAIDKLTEGNPFFIEEVLQSLVADGTFSVGDGTWTRRTITDFRVPQSMQTTIQQRLDTLSAEAAHLLMLAAVMGRRFDLTILQHIMHIPDAELIRLVKGMIAEQLVVEESADTFAFRHALTREAIYAGMLARERRTLHQTIGEATEQLYADTLDDHMADLVYQYVNANKWDKVLTYAPRAGVQAQALYAPYAALVQYSHAIDAAHHLSVAPSPDIVRARGQAYETVGDFPAARDDYARVIVLAREMDDPVAEWQGWFDLGWLWTSRDYGRASEHFQRALDLARHRGDQGQLGQTLNRIGNWYLITDQMELGRRCHEEALSIFEQLHDTGGQADTLDMLGLTNFFSGDVPDGTLYYRRAVGLFRELDNRMGLSSALSVLSMRGGSYNLDTLVYPSTVFEECVAEQQEAVRVARQIDWRAGEAAALLYCGFSLGPHGRYTEGLNLTAIALDITIEIDHDQWRGAAHLVLGSLYRDVFAFGAAQDHHIAARDIANKLGALFLQRMTTGHLASTYVASGQLDEAAAILSEALTPDLGMNTIGQRLIWAAQAELDLARNQPNAALAIVTRLIDSALDGVKSSTPNTEQTVVPRLWLLKGQALAALGELEAAESILHAAAQTAQQQGTPMVRWHALISLGQLYRKQGRRNTADAAFYEAAEVANDIAADLAEPTMRDGFLKHTVSTVSHFAPPTARRTTKRALDGLTERERQVAILIAQGKTNRGIAEILVLSERTVAKHVESILSKLGFTSRTQVVAWALDKGLLKS